MQILYPKCYLSHQRALEQIVIWEAGVVLHVVGQVATICILNHNVRVSIGINAGAFSLHNRLALAAHQQGVLIEAHLEVIDRSIDRDVGLRCVLEVFVFGILIHFDSEKCLDCFKFARHLMLVQKN